MLEIYGQTVSINSSLTVLSFYYSLINGKGMAKKFGREDDTDLEHELDEILKNMKSDILAVGTSFWLYRQNPNVKMSVTGSDPATA